MTRQTLRYLISVGYGMTCGMELDLTRLRERVDFMQREHGESMRQISLKAAGTPDLVRHLLDGTQKKTSADKLLRLAAALQCSVEYLFGQADTPGEPPANVELFDATNHGRALRLTLPGVRLGEAGLKVRNRERPRSNPKPSTAPELIEVSEYDVRVSAGAGANITEEPVRRTWALPRSYLESIGVDPRRVAFVEIVGDSMAPTLLPGDTVLLDTRPKNAGLPAIYVLWDGDATVCKRVEKVHGSDPPLVRIISENKAYSAYDVPAEWIKVVGRVAWFARRT